MRKGIGSGFDDGGGNDLNEGCGCTDDEVCNDIINDIVVEDGVEDSYMTL